jgi:type VI secretion system secreted protein VgrG
VASITQSERVLTVATPLGPDVFTLAGLSGREEISRLFSFQLDLLLENGKDAPLDQLVGQPTTVTLALPGGGSRFFNGIASRVSQGARGARFTSYRAEIVPRFWLLTRTQQSRVFAQRTVPDIVRQVLGDVSDVELRLVGSHQPRNYCVQYRESDFAFVSRLMEEEGIFYFFEHTQGGHTLVLADSPAGHPDVPGSRLVAFDAIGSGSDPAAAVFAWEKTQELRAGKVTLRDHNFQLPDDPLEGTALIRESVRVGQVTHRLRVGGNDGLEMYDYPGGYAERFDGIGPTGGEQPGELQKLFAAAQQTAQVRMDEEALPSLTVAGASNCRQFTSGHRFALERHPSADGAYVLTRVEHTVRVMDPGAGERGLQYDNRFTCIPEALPFRPPRITPRAVIPGTQSALVVGPPGEEIFTDKYGRVKVQFAWDRQGDSSCWIRVSQAWSGTDIGMFWVPEIGDEVVVAFEEGDPDRPIVLGRVFNGRSLPPPPPPPPPSPQ